MRSFGRSLSAGLAGCLGAVALVAMAPDARAEPGPAIRITEFSHSGRVARAGTGDGEYVELTNVGDASADLTGWTYDNKTATAATGLSLTPLGTVAPGESVLVTDLSAAEFRIEWGLKDSVKVLSNGRTHLLGIPDAVHVYDDSGAEVDSVTYAAASSFGKGKALAVDADHLGAKAGTAGWTTSLVNDLEGSWTSGLGSVGSPGASHHGTLVPDDVRDTGRPEAPCDTEDVSSEPSLAEVIGAAIRTWPGSTTPGTVDAACAWVTPESDRGLSGLVFDPSNADLLYALKDTSHLYRLVRSGGSWVRDTGNGWAGGKGLRFPGGVGRPDTEGMTVGPDGALYVTTERDHAAPGVPLDSVLRFDPSSSGSTLVASEEWVLTSDLGPVGADGGIESIAYLPDSVLTANLFRTDAGALYNPADYPLKASAGLFVVASEKAPTFLVYALNTDHTYTRVAEVITGLRGVMDISFDAELDRLWIHCDNTCGNITALFKVGINGLFNYDQYVHRPPNLPNFNFEGFAVAPAATAIGGAREVLWADDGNRFGHSLWSGTLPADLKLPQTVTPLPIITGTPIVGDGALTAQIGTWGPGVAVHYRWLLDSGARGEGGTVIGTDAPLPLTDPSLAGKTVVLAVTGSRTGFRDATVTAAVGITDGTLTTHVPRISGVAAVGRTLAASSAPWGPAGVALSYQWLTGGQPIAGATRSTLRLTAAQLGRTVNVRITGVKAGHATEVEQSNSTVRVKAGMISTARPRIGGTAKVGHRLVARPGRWRAAGASVRYRYQWYVNGKAVRGGTKAGLTVTRALKGKRITVKVTGYAPGHATVSRTSAATAKVR